MWFRVEDKIKSGSPAVCTPTSHVTPSVLCVWDCGCAKGSNGGVVRRLAAILWEGSVCRTGRILNDLRELFQSIAIVSFWSDMIQD